MRTSGIARSDPSSTDTSVAGNLPGHSSVTRLDWVGANHGSRRLAYRERFSNFLYVDGHVETKRLVDTIPARAGDTAPWEWGDRHYTVTPHD